MKVNIKDILTNKAIWLNVAVAILLYFSFKYDYNVGILFGSQFDKPIPYFTIFLLISLILLSVLHELSHWLSAKIQGMKNKMIGFAVFMFFVNPDMRGFKKYKKAIVGFDGSFFGLALPFIFLAFLYRFNLISPELFIFIYVVGFINAIFEVMNLLPFFVGDDGYAIASFYIKDKKKLSIFSYSFAGIFMASLVVFLNMPILAIAYFLIPPIIMWNLLVKFDILNLLIRKYNRGFHKAYSKIYKWKIPIGIYYHF